MRLSRLIRSIVTGVVLAAISVGLATGTGVVAAHAESWEPISGRGSTWSQNAIDQWKTNVAHNYGMTVNYNGEGSSAGRRSFILQDVDFAVSEIPFQLKPEDGSLPEKPTTGYAYMPIVAGGTAFMYNLKIGGKMVTNLRLSGETITKIFTNVITNWNDPIIAADNPGLTMPDKTIVPVVRSDGSGSTAQFTLWMSKQHPELWNNYCVAVKRQVPCGLTSQFPASGNMKAQNLSLGVAGYVSQDHSDGAITYVEYSYAKEAKFPVAKVLNNSGFYVEPTAPSVAVALMAAQINTDANSPDYLTQILDGVYNSADSRTYPLSSYSYLIVPTEVTKVFTAKEGTTLSAFANYMLCEGQQQAEQLGYSPLPMNLARAGLEQIKRIPGAVPATDVSECRNPTFSAGDTESSNKLASTAPFPADCDKQGTTQCATGTGGAVVDTPVTGISATDANAAAAATAAGGTAAAGTASAATVAGTTPVYDSNGALISGSAMTGTAASSPYSLPGGGWSGQQYVMLFAAVLLVGVVLLPPLLSRRLKRRTPTA